jgi:hypothetical protein
MQNGRITGELPGNEATEEKILELAMVDDLSMDERAEESEDEEESKG